MTFFVNRTCSDMVDESFLLSSPIINSRCCRSPIIIVKIMLAYIISQGLTVRNEQNCHKTSWPDAISRYMLKRTLPSLAPSPWLDYVLYSMLTISMSFLSHQDCLYARTIKTTLEVQSCKVSAIWYWINFHFPGLFSTIHDLLCSLSNCYSKSRVGVK